LSLIVLSLSRSSTPNTSHSFYDQRNLKQQQYHIPTLLSNTFLFSFELSVNDIDKTPKNQLIKLVSFYRQVHNGTAYRSPKSEKQEDIEYWYWILSWAVTLEISASRRSDKLVKNLYLRPILVVCADMTHSP
jgi:hypothetical protein